MAVFQAAAKKSHCLLGMIVDTKRERTAAAVFTRIGIMKSACTICAKMQSDIQRTKT